MSNIRLKKALLFCGISSLCSSVFALPLSSDDACKAANVSDFSQMLSCGTVEGSLRLASYSTNNAYFSNISQDTTTAGGYVNYKTARYNGFQAVIGVEGQNRLSHGSHSVSELSDGTFGIGEAYLNWTQDKFSVTVGNQKLDLPFVGDYSFYRVQPFLYQGVDMKYGDADNFVRATYINKYKSYGDDNFAHRDRYNDDPYSAAQNTRLDHVTSFGLGKKFNLNDKYLKTQAWVESYEDSFNLYYGEANLGFNKVKWTPEVSVQAAYANDIGDAQFGKVDSTSLGAQLKLKPTDKLTWRIAYDHVFNKKSDNVWGHGTLPTPYAHNTSSDPYFAQPFFTSTQDLGPGDFYTTELSSPFGQNAFVGTRLSYVAVNDSYKKLSSLNNDMYEVMFYGFYNFTGSLKGLSLSEFIGFQKQQGDANAFLQNRFGITYNF